MKILRTIKLPGLWALHSYYTLPPWAPDNSGRLLLAGVDLATREGEVFVVGKDGEIEERFGRHAVESDFFHTGFWQSWSPDGREIAFVSDETGVPKINIISIDGRNRRVLKALGSDAVTPDWSSDNKIVYATRIQGVYTIAVYDLKTGENTRITDEPGVWESPAWAADNRQVVCKRSDGAKSALYVVDTWTGRTRLLLSTPYNLSMPVWSPCAR